MLRKTFSGLIFIALLTGILTSTINIQPVEASGTIYIRADGSIDPPTANITSADNITYYFTDNNYDELVVERSNIIIDGNGYILQSPGSEYGFNLTSINNVTIRNTEIKNFDYGVYLLDSAGNTVIRNNITANTEYGAALAASHNNTFSQNNIINNEYGVWLYDSSNNTITGNNITANYWYGINLDYSSNNGISGNNITNNYLGIHLGYSSNCNVSGNNITANYGYGIFLGVSSNNGISGNNITANYWYGIYLGYSNYNSISGNNITNNGDGINLDYSSNKFYHNNFINNTVQADVMAGYTSTWDDGYPSGGNYWSDYAGTDLYSGPFQNETGSDGIGDTIYFIDKNNTDNYPLMKSYAGPHDIGLTNIATSKTVVGQGYNVNMTATIINYGEQTEAFNLTIQANSTTLYTLTQTLTSRNSTTVTFTWNTTDWTKGNYTISANVAPVQGETDLFDNNFTDGWIFVTIQGDVDGDRDVDIYDVVKITGIYHSKRGDPQFNPNSDLDDDGEIKIYDVVRCTSHYGQSW